MFTYEDFKERFGTGYANEKNKDYFHRLKRDAKLLFGNKCQSCGYDKCSNSLSFHHVIESTKLFNISGFYVERGKDGKIPKSIKLLVDELNKCIMICMNCHAEIHAGIRDISTIERLIITEESLRLRKKKTNLTLICDECGIQFDRWQGNARHATSFCSQSCNITYHGKKRRGIKLKPSKNPRPTKIEWPSLDSLYNSLNEKSFTQLGKELGVSDNAIRRHIKVEKEKLLNSIQPENPNRDF